MRKFLPRSCHAVLSGKAVLAALFYCTRRSRSVGAGVCDMIFPPLVRIPTGILGGRIYLSQLVLQILGSTANIQSRT